MKKTWLFLAILLIAIAPLIYVAKHRAISIPNSKLAIVFVLNKNVPGSFRSQKPHFTANITIKNNTDTTLRNWVLHITSPRPILELHGAKFFEANKHQRALSDWIGGYYAICGDKSFGNLNVPPYSEVNFNLTGRFLIKHYTDLPSWYFLTAETKNGGKTTWEGNAEHDLSVLKIAAKTDTLSRVKSGLNVNGESKARFLKEDRLKTNLVVPLPVSLEFSGGDNCYFTLNSATKIYLKDTDFSQALNLFLPLFRETTGFSLEVLTKKPNDLSQAFVIVRDNDDGLKLPKEGYHLTINKKVISISASSSAGIFYALQTLRQLFPAPFFSDKRVHDVEWRAPCVAITDYPNFLYRGMHLDVARHFIPAPLVKRFLDIMALLKFNAFHWHLTDDEGWRVEIKRYPELTKVGAWRGTKEVLPPALGSGTKRYGGFYTQKQINDIVLYAKERNIAIIPEIDMPGHARAMMQSLPKELIGSRDLHYDNVLSPCLEETYVVIDNVMREIVALFPGEYIHIGFDEVPHKALVGSPACLALMQKQHFSGEEDLENYFLKRVELILAKYGKKLAGWEEIREHVGISNNALAYIWRDINKSDGAIRRGLKLVLMPAQHFYFDEAYTKDVAEPGQSWAGAVDIFDVYRFASLNHNFIVTAKNNILGFEGALWSENLGRAWYMGSDDTKYFADFDLKKQMDYLSMPRMIALAEISWTPQNKCNFDNFVLRLGKLFLQKLDYYGVYYRLPPPVIRISGWASQNKFFTINSIIPGLEIRYSLNGSKPDFNSLLYKEGSKINVSYGAHIRAATCSSITGRCSREEEGANY